MSNPCHLDDEHMQFYEWSGTAGGAVMPAARKRRHPWHASYAVLALLTSLLIVGCDNKQPATHAAEDIERTGERESEPAQAAADSAPDDAGTTPAGGIEPIEPIEPPGSTLQAPAS